MRGTRLGISPGNLKRSAGIPLYGDQGTAGIAINRITAGNGPAGKSTTAARSVTILKIIFTTRAGTATYYIGDGLSPGLK